MLIPVRYRDGTYDRIRAVCLDRLIATNRVEVFWRSSGPVIVGLDPVRGQRDPASYRGIERRARHFV